MMSLNRDPAIVGSNNRGHAMLSSKHFEGDPAA
jgi:hypothetical protein